MMNNRRTILLTDGDVAEIDYPGVVTAVLLGARHFLADSIPNDADRERWLRVVCLCREIEGQVQAVFGAFEGNGLAGENVAEAAEVVNSASHSD